MSLRNIFMHGVLGQKKKKRVCLGATHVINAGTCHLCKKRVSTARLSCSHPNLEFERVLRHGLSLLKLVCCSSHEDTLFRGRTPEG